jgi:DNA-binding NtrC family response regulator
MKSISSDHLIGESEWVEETRKRIKQVAGYRSNVLIQGPTGTGKELIARALHTHSQRASGPFIPVNCSAIPNALFASQLFGHVKGAFTGAEHSAMGCFCAAEGGTIFLDEIGELDLEVQAKLLRVLQDREVTPVGSHQPKAVDVRVITATNRDLQSDVDEERFRLDLFYRINVIVIHTQPLLDRPEDIQLLANHILAKASIENGLPLKRLSPEVLSLFQAHNWPGNVRELGNVLERASMFSDDDVVGIDALDELIKLWEERGQSKGSMPWLHPKTYPSLSHTAPRRPASRNVEPVSTGKWPTLAEMEADYLRRTLEETFYNQSAAARVLDVDRKLLSRKIKKHGIALPTKRRGRPGKSRSYGLES